MANEFPHKHIIGYVHIAPDLATDTLVSNTDHSTYTVNSLFGVFAKNGRQAIDVCSETGTTFINGVDPVAAYAYAYTAIPTLENIINEKLSNYVKEHDVFHYGGILTPSPTKGGIGTFSYLTANSMVIVGTTVKVQNDGWFGNYHVHAGDLLIAYSDDATTSSTALWDIVETHLGPLNSKGTYTQTNKPNFLTNIYLNDNGDLSYSYSYFTQVHSYVNNREKTDIDKNDIVVVSNVNFDASGKFSYELHNLTNTRTHHSIEGTDAKNTTGSPKQVLTHLTFSSTGHLSYIHKELGLDGEHIDNKNLEQNGEFNVINNVWQDGDGNLSYTYSTIVFKGEHHKSTGKQDADTTFGGFDTEIRVLTNTYIDSHGSLSYTYADLKYNEQHHTQGAAHKQSEITFGKDENDEKYVYVLTGVNLSTDGTLTYSYRPLSWEEDHHDNTGKQQDSITFEKNDESVKVITNVNLGSKGELSYTYLTLSFNDEHHGTTPNNANGFIDEVYLSSEGTLSYHKTAFEVNTPKSASKTHNIRNTSSGELDVLSGISIDSDTGKISYQYKTISYNLTEDHHTTTINSGNGFVSDVYLDAGGNLTYSKQKFEISGKDDGDTDLSTSSLDVLTGISIHEDTGKISYAFETISTSHSSNGSFGTANSPYFLNNVHLNDNGVLTYSWSEFKTEKSAKTETGQIITYVHIDGTGKLTYVANVLSADSSSYGSYNLDGNSYIKVVTGITQRGDGKLSYSTTTLKHHHGTTTNSANGFVSDVYLSDNGQLSYAKTAFEVNTPTAAAKTYNIRTHSSGTINVLAGISINQDSGQISYQYNTISYDLTHTTNTPTDNGDFELDTTTAASNGLQVVTGVNLSSTGVLTYNTTDIYHGNSGVTAGTFGLDANKTYTLDNASFYAPEFTVNAQGHITAASERKVTITHPTTYTARDTKITDTNLTLGADGTSVTIISPNIKSNTYGHVTEASRKSYTITHGNSGVTAGLYGETANDSPAFSGTFSVPSFNVNAQGHITSAKTYTITMPSQSHHGGTINAETDKVVSSVSLSDDGKLSGSKTNRIEQAGKLFIQTIAGNNNNAYFAIPFVTKSENGSYQHFYVDSDNKFKYDPSTDTLYVSKINGQMTGGLTGNASTSGDNTMKIYPESSNELNFGGTGTSAKLYIGYRSKDSKPVPEEFVFGGSTGTAKITAATFNGDLSGNADTATKLATARTITLNGSVNGSGSFDGSTNLTITTTTNHGHAWGTDTGNNIVSGITNAIVHGNEFNIGNSTESLNRFWFNYRGKDDKIFTDDKLINDYLMGSGNGGHGTTANKYAFVTARGFKVGGQEDNKYVVWSNGTTSALDASDIPNLAASKITSGTFDIASIPTGTTATTVALGNHTHNYIPAGTECIELNTVSVLKNYGGFIDFHYRNNDGKWTNSNGKVYTDANGNNTYPDYTSRIIEDEPGQINVNNVKFTGGNVNTTGEITATKFVGALNGNADTTTKLKTARNIKLTGSVTGNADFDGSGNIEISTTTNHTHNFTPSGTVAVSLTYTATASDKPNNSTTSVAAGAHTHATVDNGAHTHTSQDTLTASESDGVLTITFTANTTTSSGTHGHTINQTVTGSRVNVPNTNHTHNYDKASVQSASFDGDQGTTI